MYFNTKKVLLKNIYYPVFHPYPHRYYKNSEEGEVLWKKEFFDYPQGSNLNENVRMSIC